jgi:hypothetical protein
MPVTIRNFRPDDIDAIKRLTVESFVGVSLEQNVEEAFGVLHGHDWRWRKARSRKSPVGRGHRRSRVGLIDQPISANRVSAFA